LGRRRRRVREVSTRRFFVSTKRRETNGRDVVNVDVAFFSDEALADFDVFGKMTRTFGFCRDKIKETRRLSSDGSFAAKRAKKNGIDRVAPERD